MKRIKTSIIFPCILLFFALSLKAFAQKYELITSEETYADLVEPIMISEPSSFQDYYDVNIPFSFDVFGDKIDFDSEKGINVTKFGFIADYQLRGGIAIGAFFALLEQRDPHSSIAYEIIGTSPDRILKFEWKNMGLNNHPISDFINAQLWLHEKSNIISVHIGPHHVTDIAGFKIGNDDNPTQVYGPEIGFYQFHLDSAYYPNKQELIGDPKKPQLISTPPDQALNGMPDENTVYTFYPIEIQP